MSQFEREIKQLFDNYEAPIDSDAWSGMEQKLNGGNSNSFFRQFLVAGSILSVALIGLSINYNSTNMNDHSNHIAESTNHISTNISNESSVDLSDVVATDISEDLVQTNSDGDVEIAIEQSNSKSINSPKIDNADKVSTENLSDLEKENIIGINNSLKDRAEKKSPVTEYVGDYFNLDANMTLTPNGDNKNDVFLPDALVAADNFIMKIFDKNGAMIFSSSSLENPWTGYNQITGEQTENGKYRWKVTLDNNNRREIFTGKIVVKN